MTGEVFAFSKDIASPQYVEDGFLAAFADAALVITTVFSHVLRDSIIHLSVHPSVRWSIGPSVGPSVLKAFYLVFHVSE